MNKKRTVRRKRERNRNQGEELERLTWRAFLTLTLRDSESSYEEMKRNRYFLNRG